MFKGALAGPALTAALDVEIARTADAIAAQLAAYDPVVTPHSWHRILQGAELLINFLTEPLDDEALHEAIAGMPLAMAIGAKQAFFVQSVRRLYDGEIETGMLEVLRLLWAFDTACAAHGMPLGLTTIAHAAGYLHTRRRRMVSLFYVMPQLCRGLTKARTTFDMVPFLTLLELATGPIIDLTQMRMLSYVFPDFAVESDGIGYRANRSAELLDEGALDPERISMLDMAHYGVKSTFPDSSDSNPRRLLSKAEVAHQIALIEATYAEFNLASTSFRAVSELILPLLRGPESHVVTVPALPFLAAVESVASHWADVDRHVFVHDGIDFGAALNAHQPFVHIDDQLVTNVTLLTRFINDWKNVVLARQKRFQIRSGFLFEKKVREILEEAGFVILQVRRIQRREFDVVTTKGDAIYNFQCKNTFIDSRLIEGQPARYARYNNAVVRSHRRALAKERGREQLLKDELGLSAVHHYVVTRFPVLCDDRDIIPFTKLSLWVKRH
ncbi:hypothetical protein LMIY3S_05072 [Labrys miyagiensis]